MAKIRVTFITAAFIIAVILCSSSQGDSSFDHQSSFSGISADEKGVSLYIETPYLGRRSLQCYCLWCPCWCTECLSCCGTKKTNN
nr:hypothetical protein Iba_scaffold33909CG0010 [Ipomoea batatas]GME08698.1 hypothetical protein Iba_scaffold7998CG0040 [Ipomoea batatas]